MAATTTAIVTAETSVAEQRFDSGLFEQWKAYIDVMPRTLESYNKALRQFERYICDNGIENPRAEDVVAFRDSLKETKKAGTVQTYMTAVKIFFKWTAKQGLYPNIADGIKGAKVDREHKKDALTSRQVKNLLESIDRSTLEGKRNFAMLALMVTTGLRTVSIIRANIGDLRTAGDSVVLYYQGKGHEEKAIFVKVAWQVEDAIREYLQARGETGPASPLFASVSTRNAGGRLTTRSISGIAKRSMVDIGLDSDRLTAHSLRHTAAVNNILDGGTLEETQLLLDHANISTTMIYAHTLERVNSRSEQRLADGFFS